jgi:Brp/Blh family beta-carotene 15,15'-monooxygenase
MTRPIFIFIAAIFLFLPAIFLYENMLDLESQLMVFGPVLLILGIPHGAIDNVLYQRSRSMSNVRFVSIYLMIVGAIVLLWWILPTIAYVLFLSTSAYHFGQSQFSHYFKRQSIRTRLLFWSWGILLLSSLMLFNSAELDQLAIDYSEFGSIHILNSTFLLNIVIGSGVITLVLVLWMIYRKELKQSHAFMELFVISMLLASFYILPFLIGFTLYFIILHAWKVMQEEFHFLRKAGMIKSSMDFIKLLSPFSIVSFIGIGLLYIAIYNQWLTTSFGYAILIVISAITIPHAFVMDQFYGLLFKRKFYQNERLIH